MAAMKLHGNVRSIATLRARAALCEKEIPYDFVNVDMATGGHKSPSFLKLNPFGQIPAFEDGDLVLFESRAINRYLEDNYSDSGNQLLPRDPKKRAIAMVWMEVETQKYDPEAFKLVWELVLKPVFGMTTDEAVVNQAEAKLASVLDIYEARLSESKYLGGDCFNLADLHHLPLLQDLLRTKVKGLFDSRPHVSAWASDITSRPAWLKAISA